MIRNDTQHWSIAWNPLSGGVAVAGLTDWGLAACPSATWIGPGVNYRDGHPSDIWSNSFAASLRCLAMPSPLGPGDVPTEPHLAAAATAPASAQVDGASPSLLSSTAAATAPAAVPGAMSQGPSSAISTLSRPVVVEASFVPMRPRAGHSGRLF